MSPSSSSSSSSLPPPLRRRRCLARVAPIAAASFAPLAGLCCAWPLCVAAASRGDPTEAPSGWPASLEFLSDGSDELFHEFVAPLANMTTLSYTATYGSYFREDAANATVFGWRRGTLEANPVDGGMRALVFVQVEGGRGVVAFRGTDLNTSGVSGQADQCADELLAGVVVLPPYCKRFSAETLDYVARALEFASAAAEAHAEVEWLYTGHSLGALLAEVVAAVRGTRALAFAAPSVAPVLRNHTSVDPAVVPAWSTVTLYNEWDPLRWQSLGSSVGAACAWGLSPPPGCVACDHAAGGPNMSRQECKACFMQAHVFSAYLALVRSGQRPLCAPPLSEANDIVV